MNEPRVMLVGRRRANYSIAPKPDSVGEMEEVMPFNQEDELKMRFDVVKAFGDTAKSYIQISSAALAIPLLFTQAIFGENAAKQGLRSIGVPYTVYGAWFCFVLAIVLGVLYRWASIRRVWDDLHEMQRTTVNADRPGFRIMWWVIHFPNFN